MGGVQKGGGGEKERGNVRGSGECEWVKWGEGGEGEGVIMAG